MDVDNATLQKDIEIESNEISGMFFVIIILCINTILYNITAPLIMIICQRKYTKYIYKYLYKLHNTQLYLTCTSSIIIMGF